VTNNRTVSHAAAFNALFRSSDSVHIEDDWRSVCNPVHIPAQHWTVECLTTQVLWTNGVGASRRRIPSDFAENVRLRGGFRAWR